MNVGCLLFEKIYGLAKKVPRLVRFVGAFILDTCVLNESDITYAV